MRDKVDGSVQYFNSAYRVTEEAWQLFILKLRYRDADLSTPGSSHPFLLTGDYAWIIYTGFADVFAVRLENGDPVGARRHLLRASADQVLFGFDLATAPLGLLVVCAPETQVLRIKKPRLQELAAQSEYKPIIAAINEHWAEALCAMVEAPTSPKQYRIADPGQKLDLNADEAVRAGHDVCWVRSLSSEIRFLGRSDVPAIPKGQFVPVTKWLWVQPTETATLDTFRTDALNESDPVFDYLNTFQRLALQFVTQDSTNTRRAESRLIQDSEAIDQSRFHKSFIRLASTWTDDEGLGNSTLDGQGGLVDAIQRVAAQVGFKVQLPRESTAPMRFADRVAEIARASRIRVRRVELKGQWWTADNGPLLSYLDGEENPVALIPTRGPSYLIYSPTADTPPQIVTSDLARKLGPTAYVFYRPLPERALIIGDTVRYAWRVVRPDVLTFLLVGLTGGLLGSALPVFTGDIFDRIIPGGSYNQLWLAFAILVISAIAAGLFQIMRGFALLRIEARGAGALQAAVWDRLLNLPVDFFRGYSAGDLVNRSMGIEDVKSILLNAISLGLFTGIFSFFNFLLLFYYDWHLAIIATLIVAAAFGIAIFTGQRIVRTQRRTLRLQGEISGLVTQMIRGIQKLRISGAESRAFALWADRFAEQRKLTYQTRTARNALIVMNTAFPILATLIVFAVMGNRSGLSTGQFLAFYAALTLFLTAGLQSSSALVSLLNVIPIYERMRPVLKMRPEVDDDKANPGELSGDIEVSHLSFRYRADGPMTLDDISFGVRRGEFVALVGPSGCGKSTLLRLLLGFEQPQAGVIYYDGQSTAELNMRAVRRQMGVVLQYSQVVTGEILTNIIGSNNLTIDDAWEAAKQAGVDETIRELPMGMHTYVTESGTTFSGGQKQRILIARALVMKPRIVFFDEATSALDEQAQAVVTQQLKKLQATRIVIAHRLSTIVDADRIIVLDKGRIVESGTYEELMARGRRFAELAKRQLI